MACSRCAATRPYSVSVVARALGSSQGGDRIALLRKGELVLFSRVEENPRCGRAQSPRVLSEDVTVAPEFCKVTKIIEISR